MDNGIDLRWKELCARAAIERNPTELSRVITELNLLLEQREKSLRALAEEKV
jgi:uncharacterized coiled-coil protein SlyX